MLDQNPYQQFTQWYCEASGTSSTWRWLVRRAIGIIYPPINIHPDAMALATASKDGKPSVRMVLYKGQNEKGILFYTNYKSPKSLNMQDNPYAEVVFHWTFPERQVRIAGQVEKTSPEQSEKYWKSRPRGSQLSALASEQSTCISDREYLKSQVKKLQEEFRGREIPCPSFWGGFCLIPEKFEFWEGKINRLHERYRYMKKIETSEKVQWSIQMLAP